MDRTKKRASRPRGANRYARASALLLAALLLAASLLGCTGKKYTDDEKEALRDKGKQMMQEWLNRELPGAELLSTEPYVRHNPGVAPYVLTELVSGTYRHGGQEQRYWLDTACGRVYLEQTGEIVDRLREACCAYAAEALGLGEDYETDPGANNAAWLDIGVPEAKDPLPAEFVLSGRTPEEFVRDPGSRDVLKVMFCYSVPETADLSGIGMETVLRMKNEYGLLAYNLLVESRSESVYLFPDRVTYDRYGMEDLADFRIFLTKVERREKLDPATEEITAEIEEFDPDRDLAADRTEDGWKFSFPNGWSAVSVYAYEDSELLQKQLVSRKDPADPGDRDAELSWTETAWGWTLCDANGYLYYISEEHVLSVQD